MTEKETDLQNIFEAPQMSGHNPVKIKSLGTDQLPVIPDPNQKTPKKKNKFLVLAVVFVSILLLLFIILLILSISKKKPEELLPQTSPTPQASQSPTEITFDPEIGAKYIKLDQELNNLEVQDVELIYPQITWKAEF